MNPSGNRTTRGFRYRSSGSDSSGNAAVLQVWFNDPANSSGTFTSPVLTIGNDGGTTQGLTVARDGLTVTAGGLTVTAGGMTVVAGTTEFADDILVTLGSDNDQVLVNRSGSLNANTALTGVLAGTPAAAATPANSLLISNITASGDIAMFTLLGGTNSAEVFRADTSAGLIVFNEAAADWDFRIESDGNANAFSIDAGVNGGVGAVGIGAAAAADLFCSVSHPAVTATANAEWHTLRVTAAGAVTVPTGTAAVVSSASFYEPNITATGTVTAATTVYVANAPTEGSSNYALWVDSGASRFDGRLDFSSLSPGTETDGSVIKIGTLGSPVALNTTGMHGIRGYVSSTATSGSLTGMHIRAMGNAASGGATVIGLQSYAQVTASLNAQDVVALDCTAVAKSAGVMASGGWFDAGQFKVEDARGTDGTSTAPTYGGYVSILRLMGQISADPTNGYYGIYMDFQTAGASTAQNPDGVIGFAGAGQNRTIAALLYHTDTLAALGSTSTNMISSGSLTTSGAGDVACDARIRVNLGGTSYWVPLFDTAA